MSHPAELEKFLTANAEGANASLGTGIPTGLVSDGQVNPDAARLFFNLGYGLGTLAAANVPASIKEEILGRSFAIDTGQSPTGSPDLIDGWTFTGTDASGHGIWQRLDQLNGDYGLAVTSKADAGTAAGLDARCAIRQSQQNDNNFGPPPPDQRTELDPNPDGSFEVHQVYADYTGLETVNAAGQEKAVGKMNADGSSSTSTYNSANSLVEQQSHPRRGVPCRGPQ